MVSIHKVLDNTDHGINIIEVPRRRCGEVDLNLIVSRAEEDTERSHVA